MSQVMKINAITVPGGPARLPINAE